MAPLNTVAGRPQGESESGSKDPSGSLALEEGAREGHLGLRAAWARDEEARMDLWALGSGLSDHVAVTVGKAACADMARLFEDLAAMEAGRLEGPRAMKPGEIWTLLELLSDRDCKALWSARRCWARALALAGAFGPWECGRVCFGNASEFAGRWLVANDPRMGGGLAKAGRAGGLGIDEAKRKRKCCAQFVAAWEAFGEELGVVDAFGMARAATLAALESKGAVRVQGMSAGMASWEAGLAALEGDWLACSAGAGVGVERRGGLRI